MKNILLQDVFLCKYIVYKYHDHGPIEASIHFRDRPLPDRTCRKSTFDRGTHLSYIKQTNKQTNKHTYKHTYIHTYIQTNKQTNKKTHKHNPNMGYSFRLTARVLLYAPSHRQDNTYHGLCYTSRGALAGTRNSSMGPPHEGSIRRPIAP